MARETWRRVRYVIDEARAWSDATGGTLAEYLAWVSRRIDDVDRVELSTDEGEDSLRIMTMHAAKGLEFPITIVAGLGGADASNNATGRAVAERQAADPSRQDDQFGMGDLTASERQKARAEEARLLYVAFTRAKDHLVVSMHHKGPNCAAGRLVAAVTAAEAHTAGRVRRTAAPDCPSSESRTTVDASAPGALIDEPDELDRTARPGAPHLDPQRSGQGARRRRRADVRRRPGAGLAVRSTTRTRPTTIRSPLASDSALRSAAVNPTATTTKPPIRGTARSPVPTIVPVGAAAGSEPRRAAQCTR